MDLTPKEPREIEREPRFWIAEQLADNKKKEAEAIEGYMKLLRNLDADRDAKLISAIKEIVSDEKNHDEILDCALKCYDGGIKPATDGLGKDKGESEDNDHDEDDETRKMKRMAKDIF
jgi:rubrerythrin